MGLMFDFQCEACGKVFEMIVDKSEKDKPHTHEECGGIANRIKVNSFKAGRESYQPKAIMSDGSRVGGHFGTSARKKKHGGSRL